MGNNGSRQYTYHQYYEVIKNDPNFNFKKINFELLDPHEVLEVRKNLDWFVFKSERDLLKVKDRYFDTKARVANIPDNFFFFSYRSNHIVSMFVCA